MIVVVIDYCCQSVIPAVVRYYVIVTGTYIPDIPTVSTFITLVRLGLGLAGGGAKWHVLQVPPILVGSGLVRSRHQTSQRARPFAR